ncbi:MAG TPA: aminoglycoside phosphotransferase family protein, partial [Solirubrobacteraceae bacterium]|nr:aminoglycoside phosphotransferase family protein [Solirubrobacteraceae bacterium]
MSPLGDVSTQHSWLAAVLPAHARTFRVSDPSIAATLAGAGGLVQGERADVEIADPHRTTGDAAHVVITLDATQDEGGSLAVRVLRRLRGAARVRVQARRIRRRMLRRGWAHAATVLWDLEQPVHLPGRHERLRELRPAEWLPARALVLASRAGPAPSLLDAAVAEASQSVDDDIRFTWPLAREGLMIVLSDRHVVRVAVGTGRRKLELLGSALDALAAAEPPAIVAGAIPWVEGSGRVGLADWTVERRLPGQPARRLSAPLLESCVDFLVALHRSGTGSRQWSISDDARVVAEVCSSDAAAEAVLALGARLDERLGDLDRGFGHGDLWAPNVLVQGERLSGVVDWDTAGPDRLPAIDLLHLLLTARRQRRREYIGVGLVAHHLPWARAGGDAIVRSYCRKLGISLDAGRLEALVLAYWLDRVSFELRLFADRVERPVWMRNNVL